MYDFVIIFLCLILLGFWFWTRLWDDYPVSSYSQESNRKTTINHIKTKNTTDLDNSTYDRLLQSNNWKITRERILNRDNHKCQWCGKSYNLNVHHKYYSKYPNGKLVYPWNYPDNALITLCKDCHTKAHRKPIKTYYRKYSQNYS